jgi:hypothetical protein
VDEAKTTVEAINCAMPEAERDSEVERAKTTVSDLGRKDVMTNLDLSEFRSGPFTLMWQTPTSVAELVTFKCPADWQRCIRDFALRSAPPDIVTAKYRRALTLYELAWLSYDILKAGELAVLVALELGLLNQYGAAAKPTQKPSKNGEPVRASLSQLFRYMRTYDSLTPAVIPALARNNVIDIKPILENLLRIRNGLAHGDPFDGHHQVGLLELVRDLIDYAYRVPS